MYHEEMKDMIQKFVKDDLNSVTVNYPVNEDEEKEEEEGL